VLASKWEYPLPHDTSFSTHLDRLPTDRLISVSPLHAQLAFEPKKSFIYNKIRLVADPNEPKEPNGKQSHRLASFRHSPIQIGVSSSTGPQIPSISSSVTAMQPSVQPPTHRVPSGNPWITNAPARIPPPVPT
jgi:hypothetical protein